MDFINKMFLSFKPIKSKFILFLMLSFGNVLIAQHIPKDLLYADKYFKIQDYFLASDYYEKALSQDVQIQYIHYQLGECDRLIFKYEDAELHYSKVLEGDSDEYPLASYYYALMLKNNGHFEHALEQYDSFLKSKLEEEYEEFKELAKQDKIGTLYILDEQKKALKQFNFHNVGSSVNTEESDFSPAIYMDDSSIVVSSARFNKKHEEVYGRLGGAFLDNYLFDKTTDSTWSLKNSVQNFDHLNTKYHDAASVFNYDKDAFYFTRCDEKGTNKHEYHCAIYVSELEEGKWKTPQKLNENINKKDSWNAQPSLSRSQDTLFFASKREGGLGKTDIWYSIREEDSEDLINSWGEAVNMGAPINTRYVDMSPQYNVDEDVLLFSSDGHVGFGGLDVFVASGKEFKQVRNLGLPFNSSYDDFHFVMGDSVGYLSSNRTGGEGSDDIYNFDLYSYYADLAELDKSEDVRYDHVDMTGKISAQGIAVVDSVEIIVMDTAFNIIKSTATDQNGYFSLNDINLQDKREVIIKLPKVHLLSDYNFIVDSLAFKVKSSVVLVPSNDTTTIDLGGRVLDDKGNPVYGQKVILLDENGIELMHTLTNEDGQFMFRSLDGSKEYTLKLENGDNLISNVQIVENKQGINTQSIEEAENGVASRIKTESIYFDFTKSDIRKEAKKTLKEVATLLKKYPNVSLELHGYTDNFGSSEFNIILGEKRGNSALKFLQSHGIDKSRIQVKTHGESEPVASNETFEGRQLNRRVDFYILGGVKYNQTAQVHILKPGTTLNDVAQKYNMTLEELNELNDLSKGEKVDSYSPIRVKRDGAVTTTVNQKVSKLSAGSTAQLEDFKYIIKSTTSGTVKYRADSDKGFYMVLHKNTLYSIATINKVSIEEIKKWNNLNSTVIYAGQILQVVENPSEEKSEYLKNHISNLPLLENNGLQVNGDFARYVVKYGDSFINVARKFNMNYQELKSINDLPSFDIVTGMIIKVKITE